MRHSSIIAWLLPLAALAGCGGSPPAAGGAAEPEAGTLAVRRSAFEERFVLAGELQAVESERIVVPHTPVFQLQVRWMEADGTLVQQGQKVLELDNTQFAGELEQKRLAHDKAAQDLVRKQADIDVQLADRSFALASHRVARDKARIEAEVPQDLRPQREHEEKQLALTRAETEYNQAHEELDAARRAAEAELGELRIALSRARTEIGTVERAIAELTRFAPSSGILVVAENDREGRKFQAGDSVWVGLAVMSIPRLTRMRAVGRLSDVDDGRIAPGLAARCTLDAYPDRSYEGEVEGITPIAQEDSPQSLRRSFRVSIPLEGSDPERMRPGMSVRVEVLFPRREGVLIVPRQALDLSGPEARLLLADGSAARVVLGPCAPTECVLEEGGPPEGTPLRAGA